MNARSLQIYQPMVYSNTTWAIDALTIILTQILFGRITPEIAMGSHHVWATLGMTLSTIGILCALQTYLTDELFMLKGQLIETGVRSQAPNRIPIRCLAALGGPRQPSLNNRHKRKISTMFDAMS
jgi:hypothetical protein